ncbi:MAG: hypothetical protein GY757_20850 [bacterium]|nr:hypothetical protein [bacterium]
MIKKKIIVVVICLIVMGIYGFSADKKKQVNEPTVFDLDPFLMSVLPGANFYTYFIENYAPDATLLIEESNGFSMLDNPRVYFEGDSFINFNWYFNGFNINSSLADGTPAVLLPFSSVAAYRLRGESPLSRQYGMNFVPGMPAKSSIRVTASSVYSDMGSYLGTFFIQPSHPSERADRLYNERRKIQDNYFFDLQWNRRTEKSLFSFSIDYFDMTRQFNDFNLFDSTFDESGKMLLFNTRYCKEVSGGSYEVFGIYNRKDRSAQGAEIAAYPQETTVNERNALMAGFHLKKKSLDLKISVLYEKEQLTPYEDNFSKDLMDTDGDGFYTFNKLGEFTATTLNASVDVPLRPGRHFYLTLFADARYSNLSGKEEHNDFNAFSFDGNPYMVVLWDPASDYSNTNTDMKAGLRLQYDISENISLLGKIAMKYNALGFDNPDNNISFFTPGFDIGVLLFKNKKTNILFSYGRTPYDIRENVNLFLENQRPTGTYYRWQDSNNDHSYQQGETNTVFGYTGGNYHFLDENLKAPIKERLLLEFSTPISKNFRLHIKGLYKKIKNNFRVKFNSEYGYYETHNGHDLYFFDQPFKDYYLTNNYLEKDPFYAQFHFTIKGRKKNKWFFSFTFMAHMGMGDTAFGNGPGSNDIGILDESQANPNSWINGFGRLDGDRGFVSKTYFGFYLSKKLFMSFSLKYRDGNPFAFIENQSAHDQLVLYYKTIKAEDEKGVKGGPREDYLADVNIKLNYKFRLLNKEAVLSLSFFNIFDFGAELSEYAFSGGTRDAVELQVPRSLRLTLNWKF